MASLTVAQDFSMDYHASVLSVTAALLKPRQPYDTHLA